MTRILTLILCALLLCSDAEARFLKPLSSAVATPRIRVRTVKKQRRIPVRKRKTPARHTRVQGQSAADWDAIMRRNAPVEPQPMPDEISPEEAEQWMKNFSDAEFDLYLKMKIADAIPFLELERIAKKRKIR